jgi:hypothetical protein
MHNPRFWILSVITGFRTAEPFRIFRSILRYQHFPHPPTGSLGSRARLYPSSFGRASQ